MYAYAIILVIILIKLIYLRVYICVFVCIYVCTCAYGVYTYLCLCLSRVYRWYKFDDTGAVRRRPVQLSERVRQVAGTLIIRQARVADSGKYLCEVNNTVGGESVETVLTVTGEPTTPSIN